MMPFAIPTHPPMSRIVIDPDMREGRIDAEFCQGTPLSWSELEIMWRHGNEPFSWEDQK
jgi:hypothetical protein